MDPINNTDLAALINELRDEVRGLAGRVAALEQAGAAGSPTQDAAAPAVAHAATSAVTSAATSPATSPARQAAPTEEDLLVIAAAVAAYLGVRARIRQVRLIQSTAWAQVGRATVHASHRVH